MPSETPSRDPSRRRKLLQKAKLPMLSGKATALVVFLLLIVTAILIPVASRLPVWIEAELVLAAWWLIWVMVLTYLLHRGHQVSHDHELRPPRNWWSWLQHGDWSWADLPTAATDAEGCLILLLILLALPIVIGLLWVVVELAIPAVVFLMYLLVRGMLAHVANDTHDCEDRLDRALFWAITWATLYTAPLGFVVWFVHWLMA